MTIRKLPGYIEFRRDRLARCWRLICRACGIKETYWSYWIGSRAAWAHADMHEAGEEED